MTTSSFGALKRNSKQSLEKLTQAVSALSNNNGDKDADNRFWNITKDKTGNGMAVIRFLPAPPNEDLPFVKLYKHGFQGPGGWYLENCPTTIGRDDCPCCKHNSALWNTGLKENQETVRKQKRGLSFFSNIYVVKDPGNPENEAKVFLFRYGKKIFDKLNDLMHPQFADEEERNPFDLWEGANFRLKIRQVENFANYDKSEFDAAGPLFDDDEKLEAIWKQEHSLVALVDPKEFKSANDLQKRLEKALGLGGSTAKSKTVDEDDEPEVKEAPKAKAKEAPKQKVAKPRAAEPEDDEDSLAFFRKLAESDED